MTDEVLHDFWDFTLNAVFTLGVSAVISNFIAFYLPVIFLSLSTRLCSDCWLLLLLIYWHLYIYIYIYIYHWDFFFGHVSSENTVTKESNTKGNWYLSVVDERKKKRKEKREPDKKENKREKLPRRFGYVFFLQTLAWFNCSVVSKFT